MRDGVEQKYFVPWLEIDGDLKELENDAIACRELDDEHNAAIAARDGIMAESVQMEKDIQDAISTSENDYERIEGLHEQCMRARAFVSPLKEGEGPNEKPFFETEQAAKLYSRLYGGMKSFCEAGFALLPEFTDVERGFAPLTRKETNYAVFDMATLFVFIIQLRKNSTDTFTYGQQNSHL